MKTKDKNLNKIEPTEARKDISSRNYFTKYSALEKRAARELYYQLGENRSMEKVFKILGIGLTTLKTWASAEGWKNWAEARQAEDEKLALQGKYSTQILGLNAKAKAFLEEIIEWSARMINNGKFDIRASDAVNAAKLLLGLAEADKTPDILNTAVPIVIVVDKKEMENLLKEEKLKETGMEIEIVKN